MQPTWTDEATNAMTAYDNYRVGRDALPATQRQDVAPYHAPNGEIVQQAPNVGGPLLKLAGIGVVAWVCVITVKALAVAVWAFVSAYAVPIGAVVVLASLVAGKRAYAASETAPSRPSPTGGGGPQNITVIVNVAGHSVVTNTTSK